MENAHLHFQEKDMLTKLETDIEEKIKKKIFLIYEDKQ